MKISLHSSYEIYKKSYEIYKKSYEIYKKCTCGPFLLASFKYFSYLCQQKR